MLLYWPDLNLEKETEKQLPPVRPPPPPTPVSPDNRSWERAVSDYPEALFCAFRIIEFQRREQMDCIFLTFSWFQCANSYDHNVNIFSMFYVHIKYS